MRFTSLIIELIRARPRLVVWIVVLCQAALWLLLPMLLYRSPPGDLATVLAYGREYQVGTNLGPPLAFWLADIAFRAAGNHMFGVYLLAQLCSIATFWSLYLLARAVVGGQQAVLAVLLTMTIAAFSSPGVEFGPLVLARPLWALLLLHSWRLIGQHRRNAWFAWSIEAGLLLLTTPAAIGLLLLIAAFALATARGRRTLMSFDPLFALLVIVVLALPYLIWLIRADTLASPPWPALADLQARGLHWATAARRPAARGFRRAAAGGSELRLVRPHPGRCADHLPAAGRTAGARFRLFFRHRAGVRGKPGRRSVRSRPGRGRGGHRIADDRARRDRCHRRSGPSCGASACCDRCGRQPSSPLRLPSSRRRCFCPGSAAARLPRRCPPPRSRIFSATALNGEPISGCAR